MLQPKLSTRFTEDFHHVSDNETVYEILYSYDNPESSTAYPEQNKASKVPLNFPIWLHKENCQRECNKRNIKPIER